MKHVYVGQHVVGPDKLVGVIREIQDHGRVIVEYTKQVAWAQSVLEPYSPDDEKHTDETLLKVDAILKDRGLSPLEASMVVNAFLNEGLLIRERS